MSDMSSIERYCSSYYDKHGLYNDGFPCPNDKYCCQTSDGAKMCCDLNFFTTTISKSNRLIEKSTKSNLILNTILNNGNEFNSNNKFNKINSFTENNLISNLDTGSSSILFNSSSSISTLPFLFSK
jgi:hypothetical protein